MGSEDCIFKYIFVFLTWEHDSNDHNFILIQFKINFEPLYYQARDNNTRWFIIENP